MRASGKQLSSVSSMALASAAHQRNHAQSGGGASVESGSAASNFGVENPAKIISAASLSHIGAARRNQAHQAAHNGASLGHQWRHASHRLIISVNQWLGASACGGRAAKRHRDVAGSGSLAWPLHICCLSSGVIAGETRARPLNESVTSIRRLLIMA